MMTTRITVVDGADGLTPDMLRRRPRTRETFGHYMKYWKTRDEQRKNNV